MSDSSATSTLTTQHDFRASLVIQPNNTHLPTDNSYYSAVTKLPVRQSPRANRGVARNLFRRGDKTGGMPDWGQKSPSGSRGRALVGVWGLADEDIYANNHCNNVLSKKPKKFQHGNFRGGGMSPLPPPLLPYAPEGKSRI